MNNTHDPVNHPEHYTSHPSGVECIDITRHMTFNIGNVKVGERKTFTITIKGLNEGEHGIDTLTKSNELKRTVKNDEQVKARNVVDAAAAGATEGLRLAANVAAMLVAFVALIAMLNWPLAAFCTWQKFEPLTFQAILGMVFKPLAWCMGVPAKDCGLFGAVLGQQVIATEFVAYLDLGKHIANGTMDKRSCQIATYALCGFANLPSIAIQIGGFSAMAPSRRGDFAAIAPRAMVAGALACWMTGAIAGLFI